MAGNSGRIRLRLIVLGVALIVSIIAVFYCQIKATPGKESRTLERHAPVAINVYSSDLTTSASLTAVVNPGIPQGIRVYLSIKDPKENRNTTILVTSSVKPLESEFRQVNLYTGYYHRMVDRKNYVEVFSASIFNYVNVTRMPGVVLASFNVDATQQTKGSFFAHLPALATNEITSPDEPPNALPPLMTDPKGLLAYPVERGVRYPIISNSPVSHKSFKYRALSAGHHDLYWQPVALSTKEVLSYVGPVLQAAHIDNLFPPNGNLIGQSFIWHTSGAIESTLSATNTNDIASQSHYSFLSGILIGVVLSVAFALVAELPEKTRWPLRRRC